MHECGPGRRTSLRARLQTGRRGAARQRYWAATTSFDRSIRLPGPVHHAQNEPVPVATAGSKACDGCVESVRFASLQGWIRMAVPNTSDARDLIQTQRKHMAAVAANELGPMLTASEVAGMLHLHVNTVKRLGDRGELPFYRVCKRGDRRFRLEDVMSLLDRNR